MTEPSRSGDRTLRAAVAAIMILSIVGLMLVLTRNLKPDAPMPAVAVIADLEQLAYLDYAAKCDEGCLVKCATLPHGSARRHYLIGLVHKRKGEAETARHWFTVAHRLGDPMATRQLQVMDDAAQ